MQNQIIFNQKDLNKIFPSGEVKTKLWSTFRNACDNAKLTPSYIARSTGVNNAGLAAFLRGAGVWNLLMLAITCHAFNLRLAIAFEPSQTADPSADDNEFMALISKRVNVWFKRIADGDTFYRTADNKNRIQDNLPTSFLLARASYVFKQRLRLDFLSGDEVIFYYYPEYREDADLKEDGNICLIYNYPELGNYSKSALKSYRFVASREVDPQEEKWGTMLALLRSSLNLSQIMANDRLIAMQPLNKDNRSQKAEKDAANVLRKRTGSQPRLSYYETGRDLPQLSTIVRLFMIYDVCPHIKFFAKKADQQTVIISAQNEELVAKSIKKYEHYLNLLFAGQAFRPKKYPVISLIRDLADSVNYDFSIYPKDTTETFDDIANGTI